MVFHLLGFYKDKNMGLQVKEIKGFGQKISHAFKIDSLGQQSNGNYQITVSPGSVNNVVPTNIINGATLAKFSVTKDSVQYVILTCTTDGKAISQASISVRSQTVKVQTAIPFGLPSSFEVLIGIVYNDNIYQCVTTNLNLGGKSTYVANQAQSQPGTLPYTIYLIWG